MSTQQYHIPDGDQYPVPTERKRKRVFMWTFISVQLLYVTWIITGIINATSHANTTCAADPSMHNLCVSASQAGGAIGVGIIIALWLATDIILGIGRLIVLTSRRRNV